MLTALVVRLPRSTAIIRSRCFLPLSNIWQAHFFFVSLSVLLHSILADGFPAPDFSALHLSRHWIPTPTANCLSQTQHFQGQVPQKHQNQSGRFDPSL